LRPAWEYTTDATIMRIRAGCQQNYFRHSASEIHRGVAALPDSPYVIDQPPRHTTLRPCLRQKQETI
jgi:hypothetical protein